MKRLALSVAVPLVLLAIAGACHKNIPPGADGRAQGSVLATGAVAPNDDPCQLTRDIIEKLSDESKPQSPYYRGGALEYFSSFTLKKDAGSTVTTGELFAGWSTPDAGPRGIIQVEGHGQEHGDVCKLKLTPVFPDAGDRLESVQLYEVKFEGEDLCANQSLNLSDLKEPRSRTLKNHKERAIAVPGYWEAGAWHQGDGTRFTLSCFTGVVAKCVAWDYVPWVENQGLPLKTINTLHQTCVHAARARYLGDQDTSFTCTGTSIDIFDIYGIQEKGSATSGHEKLEFESLWNENGAVCVQHPRWQNCNNQLTNFEPETCQEPPDGGGPWRNGGLIGIRSSTMNRTLDGACPSKPDAGCPQDAGAP